MAEINSTPGPPLAGSFFSAYTAFFLIAIALTGAAVLLCALLLVITLALRCALLCVRFFTAHMHSGFTYRLHHNGKGVCYDGKQ